MKAIFDTISALFAMFFGMFSWITSGLNTNEAVISHKFDKATERRRTNYRRMLDAIARQGSALKRNEGQLRQEKEKLNTKEAALQAAQKLLQKTASGISQEEASSNKDFLTYSKAVKDKTNEVAKQKQIVSKLEIQIDKDTRELDKGKQTLKEFQESIKELDEEKQRRITNVITAREKRSSAELKQGILLSGDDDDLNALRRDTDAFVNSANISEELADVTSADRDQELIELAGETEANDNMFAGLKFKDAEPTNEPATKLPE